VEAAGKSHQQKSKRRRQIDLPRFKLTNVEILGGHILRGRVGKYGSLSETCSLAGIRHEDSNRVGGLGNVACDSGSSSIGWGD
jgi:hypothetical protein